MLQVPFPSIPSLQLLLISSKESWQFSTLYLAIIIFHHHKQTYIHVDDFLYFT